MKNTDIIVPQLMKLLKFHEGATLEQIRRYTMQGKIILKSALDNLIKTGLVAKKEERYILTDESRFWLGWGGNQWG